MAASEAPRGDVPALDGLTALCVEGDLPFRAELADELRCAGWQVIEVATADAALDVLCQPLHIDLVLTTLHTRGFKNGLDVARTAAAKRPSMAIVMVAEDSFQLEKTKRLWNVLLPKPVSVCLLVQLVASLRSTRERASAGQPLLSIPAGRRAPHDFHATIH